MTDESKKRMDSRSLLLTVALASLPVAGCDPLFYPPEQQQLYSEVVATKDPAVASDFIRKYPDSPLVRDVLLNLPPASLKRLSRSAVRLISPEVIRTLPVDLIIQLGLSPPATPAPVRAPKGGYTN